MRSLSELSPNRTPSRIEKVREVVRECFQRRSAGEAVSDESVMADHPDLLPELAAELEKLRQLEAAWRIADSEQVEDQPDNIPIDSGQELCVRCPHCHTPTPVVVESSLADIACSACGAHFSLVGADEDEDPLDGVRRIGRFELIEQLGVGGFGAVWKAFDPELDRLVALKVPRRGQLTAAETEQFFREARAAAQLRHPNIVSVFEVGRDGDRVYIVSDLVEGPSLAEWTAEERMSIREAAEFCRKVAEALAHAHAAGVIHRDLKPANILVDSEGQPHLTDFGLASRKAQETTVTADGQMLGTPAYMSPEQARGEAHSADHASDIFSLGVILYELIIGELPFRGSVHALLEQIVSHEPSRPRSLNRLIPRDLETICLKCLEKVPVQRYSTAKGLAQDLHRLLRSEPIHARRIAWYTKASRWCKRNSMLAGLMATVIISLATGAVLSVAFGLRARERAADAWVQSRRAERETIRATNAENDARMKLADSYREKAKALRVSHRPGQRFAALDAIRQASAITGPTRDLADEAAAALCLPDMAPSRVWNGFPKGSKQIAFDASLGKYARSDSQNRISVRRVADDVELKSLPISTELPIADYGGLEFSPDGELLHVRCSSRVSARSLLFALDDAEAKPIIDDQHVPFSFSPDSRRLAAGYGSGLLLILDARRGEVLQRYTIPFHDTEPNKRTLHWNPAKPQLAIGRAEGGWTILNLESGEFSPFVDEPVFLLAWHPNGRDLAACTNPDHSRSIMLVDAVSGDQVSAPTPAVLHGGLIASFNHRGDLLVSNDWSGTRRLLDPYGGRELLKLGAQDGNFFAFGPTDERAAVSIVGEELQILQVAAGSEELVVRSSFPSANWSLRQLAADPGGRLLVVEHDTGMALIDVYTGRIIGIISSPETMRPFGFDSTGALRAFVGNRLCRWPLTWAEDHSVLNVSRPQQLPVSYAGMGADQNSDGQVIGVASTDHAEIFHLAPQPRRLQTPLSDQDVRSCSISPDGRFLATGNHTPAENGENMCVWDAASGQLVKAFPCGGLCNVRFSPSGTWLSVASGTDYACVLLRVNDWQAVATFPHFGRPAFSPDDRLLAFGDLTGVIDFYEAATGRKVAQLSSVEETLLVPQSFSPDGTRLYALGQYGSVHIWDLARIHAGLENLGTGAMWPEFRRADSFTSPPAAIRVEIEAE